jgi:Lon protease-like protein
MTRSELAASCVALRLFPLPGALLMPGATLPLHVFEPRYRKLVADALASDGVLCIPQIVEGEEDKHAGSPHLYRYAVVGRIIAHHELPDGRYNIVVRPLGRVRLLQELTSPTPYRVFAAELLPETDADDEALARSGKRLLALMAPVFAGLGEKGEPMRRGLEELDLARIPEALAPFLVRDAQLRQEYIARDDGAARAAIVEQAALTLMAEARGQAGEA